MKDILEKAKHLYDLGFAIHLLHPKSKRPIESGWTTGKRKTWAELKNQFEPGMNIGVRLGTPSKIKGHFLAVIDVDVKSKSEKHRKEVAQISSSLTKGLTLPEVQSGRGNDSRHYYVLTKEPVRPAKLHQSKELVKVAMPSSKPSKREVEQLTKKELESGLRLRPAWEIAVMGEGQQVVLPDSLHPDSGKAYLWRKGFSPKLAASLKLKLPDTAKGAEKTHKAPTDLVVQDFEVEPVDLGWLPIPEKVRQQILTGEGVDDRSATLLPVCHALHAAGLTTNEILTVLTDTETFLGQCAYEHAQTSSRARAAKWVYNYTLKKVLKETSAAEMFGEPIGEAKRLTDAELIADQEAADEMIDWQSDLDQTKNGYKASLRNVIMILEKEVGPDLFKRDLFAYRDFYTRKAPWRSKPEQLVGDDDMIQIRKWLSDKFGIEPSKQVIGDAVTYIAIENGFDPLKDWLNELPEWDGTDRLDTWLAEHFEAKGDPEYLAQVFRKWMVAMVMRVEKPGAHFPWMPIFEGAQGVGKSSFGRLLVSQKYFLDWLPSLADKDAALALQGMWAVEMGELASLRKNELETVKAFLPRTIDKVRPPYGERMIESPRRCVFFGTTNSTKYLIDDSGNRRFKPIMVGQLDFETLINEREQLFAEALWLYRNGFESESTVELSGEAKEFEFGIHRQKMIKTDTDLMAEILYDFFMSEREKKGDSKFPLSQFKIMQLFGVETVTGSGSKGGHGPLHRWQYTPRNVQFAGNALTRIKAVKEHTKYGNLWKWAHNE